MNASTPDIFRWIEIGPGLTLVPLVDLVERMTPLGFPDERSLTMLLTGLGVHRVDAPNGLSYIHWEAFVHGLISNCWSDRPFNLKNGQAVSTPLGSAEIPAVPYRVLASLIIGKWSRDNVTPTDLANSMDGVRTLAATLRHALNDGTHALELADRAFGRRESVG